MNPLTEILRKTIIELVANINTIDDLNYLISQASGIIAFRENEMLGYNSPVQEVSEVEIDNQSPKGVIENQSPKVVIENQSPKEDISVSSVFSKDENPTITESKSWSAIVKANAPPSSVCSNSVSSTICSRDNEQQGDYDNEHKFIKGITKGSEKLYIIHGINDFIESMLEQGIEFWKIQYYIYFSNKENDTTCSVSKEDAKHQEMAPKILEAYTQNKLLNFDNTHNFYEFIEYYFNKIVKKKDGKYSKNITAPIVLKVKFLLQINRRIMKQKY